MPQAGQDPALHQQHALLGLGLVAGFARTRRQDGHPVVLGPLLVAGVDVGIVAAGTAHPAAQVVGDDECQYQLKIPQKCQLKIPHFHIKA